MNTCGTCLDARARVWMARAVHKAGHQVDHPIDLLGSIRGVFTSFEATTRHTEWLEFHHPALTLTC
eukprot:4534609-Pleurochrysis_carterae.AAC.11